MLKGYGGKAKVYLGAFLVYQRKMGYGFTQHEIARRTGLTQAQLSNYENGKTLPSMSAIIAIADLLDVSIDYMLGRCQNREAHKTTRTIKYLED